MNIKPSDVDKAICEYSMTYGHQLTDFQQGTLTAFIFNRLFSDNLVHTVPNDGLHCESIYCWCGPSETKEGSIVHYKNTEEGH